MTAKPEDRLTVNVGAAQIVAMPGETILAVEMDDGSLSHRRLPCLQSEALNVIADAGAQHFDTAGAASVWLFDRWQDERRATAERIAA